MQELWQGLRLVPVLIFPFPGKSIIIIKVLVLTSFYAVAGFITGRLMEIESHFMLTVLLILSGFLPAVVTGSFFRDLTSEQTADSVSSAVYSADLSGSAMGFIAFSGLAIPLLGIGSSLIFFPWVILAGFLFKPMSRKH